MLARVIVDVPTGQTDRLFDYLIPDEWDEMIEKGIRVVVPFGNRYVQGFVVDFAESSSIPLDKLKQIKEILDPVPVLTKELMELAEWLAETTLCFKISAYQVMLPAALKGKVKKQIVLQNVGSLPAEVIDFFGQNKIISFDEAIKEKKAAMKIKEWIKNNFVEVQYIVKQQGSIKKQKVLCKNIDDKQLHHYIETMSKKANKQKALIQLFIDQEKIPLSYILENKIASRQTVKALVERKLLREMEEEVYRDPFEQINFPKTQALPLTTEQKKAIDPILATIKSEQHRTFLLHGVTGSGKTEIYLQSIEQVLNQGKEAILLVPEISLTPQMVERFKGRFGSQVAVMHSGLSAGEKYDEWRKIAKKEVRVVVGARSAIFAPFENLGLIIIDEEHEGSYKQEDHPRYHAREVAIYRGMYHNCPVILGSATPSLESYARALKGRYELVTLAKRVNQMRMPKVEIVDMREELRAGNRSMFSRPLYEKIKQRLENKEQIVLLLNRRGHSTFILCRDCGYVPTCIHCEISLTYHKTNHSLRCHYCGYEEPLMIQCPSCNSKHFRFFGTGTQKAEEELGKLFPEARVIRMDVDTTRGKGSHQKLLDAFGKGKADILLGTQMIAKGLDFPKITLVGVLAADTMLHLPDFRSAERTFQLLTQVSGRAGRHELLGEVIVQTYTPDHYSIGYVTKHDYLHFFYHEMQIRKTNGYPPYYYLALIQVSHSQLLKAVEVSEKIYAFLTEKLSKRSVILKPTASPIARMKDRYRYQCMIKYKNEPKLNEWLKQILLHYSQELSRGDLQIAIDTNPQVFM